MCAGHFTRRNGLLVWYTLLFGAAIILHVFPRASSVKIGLLAVYYDKTYTGYLSIHHMGSAINIANDKLIEDGILNETFSIVWPEFDTVSEATCVGNVVDLVRNKDVDAVFGTTSSRYTMPAAHLTSSWNLPHITWYANAFSLSNKTQFKTFIRTAGPISEVGGAIVTLFKAMDWQKISFLYTDVGTCEYVAQGTRSAIAQNNITELQTITYTRDTVVTDDVIDTYLRVLKPTSRIIFICDTHSRRRQILIRACKYNAMCNGEYLFLTASLSQPTEKLYIMGDEYDEDAREAFKYLVYLSTAKYVDEDGKRRLDQFNVDVIERMSEKPWYSDTAKRYNVTAYSGAQYLHDGAYFYGLWLNYSRRHGLDSRDGKAMMNFSKGLSFPGLSGSCDFGMNGDRLPWMWIYQFINGAPEIVAIADTKNGYIRERAGFRWFTKDGGPPADTPVCGYVNELCLEQPHTADRTVLLSVLLTVFAAVMGSVATGIAVRKWQIENSKIQSIWRVDNNDVSDIRKRQIENSMIQSIWRVDINELELIKSTVGRGSRFNVGSQAALSQTSQQAVQVGTTSGTIGMLRGQEVVIRTVSKLTHPVLNRNDMIHLKTMRQLVHDNINPFVGATFNIASPCVMFNVCRKGSLQDVLENDDILLDSMFKFSMTMDVIRGMLYLHSSKLGFHGRLKSSNCIVDGRWMVKITDFGLGRFVHNSTTENGTENERYKSLLWTAPELLLSPKSHGTREGDVYGFAVIMHEIFYRQGTFAGSAHMTAKEIVERVRKRETPPFRPEIFNDVNDVSSHVIKLMRSCWNDNETERPLFKNIQNYLKDTMNNRNTNLVDVVMQRLEKYTVNLENLIEERTQNTNLVDVVMQRLEKYAVNLENLIEERTQQLVHEKQKADKLLYRMMPQSCAEQLKMGEPVHPELFNSCTVFFSDIVGFTTICSRSTPIQVVDFLNDLYICFDDIIENHDAYKVETIGDAYLVVSGVPKRNANRHSGIIADMSLDILNGVNNFKLRHLPKERLMVRIGLHTGSCCAGVVGLSMPRYCLFGDTINTASRMESNGEKQKIHISETTHAALQHLGGYFTVLRGEMAIKGKGIMRTYWLQGREGTTLDFE